MDPIYHMTYLQAVVIGLIQGLTELFPISSLGHTVLIPSWMGGTWATLVRQESNAESPYLAFIVGLHLATAVVLIGYYFRTWVRIIRGFFTSIIDPPGGIRRPEAGLAADRRHDPGGDRRAGRWSTRSGSCSPSRWPRRSSSPSTAASWPARRSCAGGARRPPTRLPARAAAPARAGGPAVRRRPSPPERAGRPSRGRGAARRAARGTVPLPRRARRTGRRARRGGRAAAGRRRLRSPRCGSARRRSWPCSRASAARGSRWPAAWSAG